MRNVIDILCPDLKRLYNCLVHIIMTCTKIFSLRHSTRELQIPETPIRNSWETGHSNFSMTIYETPSSRQVATRNTSTSMSPKNVSVCTCGIVRLERNLDTFEGRSND